MENEESQVWQDEEYGDMMALSTADQVGIAAFFVGSPMLAMGAIALGWGEVGFVSAIVGAGVLGLVGKALLDKNNAGDEGKPRISIPIIDQFRNADWGAVFRPVESGEDVTPAEVLSGEASPPLVPEPSEAVHEDCLNLSSTLRPHANRVLSNRVAILGIPGAGKSNTVAVFAEELGRFGEPLIIFDTENEYGPLCARPYFKRPFAADANSVTLETAFAFGQQIMEQGLQVVLNLDSYYDDDTAALVMIDVIRGIQAWEEALPNDDRVPCAIILDEAAVWLPQNAKESMLSKEEDENGSTTLDKLQKIFFSVVVRRGRKRGIGFILASQRSAEIDKRAISSAQWKFLLEQNMPNDLKVYHEFGVDKEIAQSLGNGQAFVLGPGAKGVHQMRKRSSPDNAKSPDLESLRKRRYTEGLSKDHVQQKTIREPLAEPMAPQIDPLPVRQIVQYSSAKGPVRYVSEEERKIKKALQYCQDGYGSVRKLETISGWSNGECRRIMKVLREQGLIGKTVM